MKRRFISCLVSSLIVASMLSGCQNKSDASSTEQSGNNQSTESGQTAGGQDSSQTEDVSVYGEIVSVSDTEIKVKKGTLNDSSQGSDDVLTLTDEEATYSINSDAEVTMSMQGFGGFNGEKPSGDFSGEKPSGDFPGNPPSDSGSGSSDSGDSSQKPSMPSGDFPGNPPSDSGSGSSDSSDSSQKPSMPGGDFPGNPPSDSGSGSSDSSDSSQKPSMPSGDFSGEMPSGGFSGNLTVDMLKEGESVGLVLDASGNVSKIVLVGGFSKGGMNFGGGASNGASSITYTAVNEISEDSSISETISSTGKDENAIYNSGYTVNVDGATISRTSSDSTGGDNASFYGVGAAILTTDGTTTVKNTTITTDSAGGAGVFSYGSATSYVSDSTITTTKGTSGGIHVAGGGKLYAYDLSVTTNGESSAAIRSDRGGGTMVVDGGTYTSNGTGSPAVYSTADITVNEAELEATTSEAVCIEGKNTLRLYDTTLTGNMGEDSRNDCTWNVIVYQSMSGDAEEGTGTFQMSGGKLISKSGGMFYTTNTKSIITIEDVDITNAENAEFFLKCTGNSNERGWGQSGSNGAECKFTAISQDMSGNIVYDSISKLDFYIIGGSVLEGAFVDDESNAGSGGDGYANVYIDASSKWIVTGDSVVTNLYSAGTIVDTDGNKVSIVGTDGTEYVSGDSDIKITVSNYESQADVKDAGTISNYSNYAVDKQ